MDSRTIRLLAASLLFLISGSAALIYQVIWQRVLGIFSGLHIYSVTLIVTAFMTGLGFGSFLGGRWADRITRRQAVLAFGACELAIGLFAVLTPWLYYDVAYTRLGFLVQYPVLLPLVHFLLLIVPTFLMGASLPLLARGLVSQHTDAAKIVGTLYGLNTLGAALGAFVATWVLVRLLGFTQTIHIAAGLNLIAAAGAIGLLGIGSDTSELDAPPASGAPSPPTAPATPPVPQTRLVTWATIYGVSGFLALSLEILWFRILDVSIKSSPYTFGHLLGAFLLFLGLGSVIGAWTVRRFRRPDLVFLWGQWSISLVAVAGLLLVTRWPPNLWPWSGLVQFWSTDLGVEMYQIGEAWQQFSGWPPPEHLWRAIQIYGLFPIYLLAFPTLLMGWTYAFIQATVHTDLSAVGWRVGVIQSANIIGSILGSLLTGALFLGILGTPGTLRLLPLLALLFPWLALQRAQPARINLWRGAVVVLTLGLIFLLPARDGFWARFHGVPAEQLLIEEDSSSVVALQQLSGYSAVLRVNGTGHSVLPYGGAHTILGSIPALMHPNPEEVLIIGLGAGNTAWAAGALTSKRLDVYEIAEPEYDVIRRFEDAWFSFAAVDQLLQHPKLRLFFSDGRLALRVAGQRYDVIEADALEPYMSYSGNLYSKEFFESARAALKPGGLFCTYTPTERTKRTMVRAFPYVLHFHAPRWLGFMIGSNEPMTFDADLVRERVLDPALQDYYRKGNMHPQVNVELNQFLDRVRVTAIDTSKPNPFQNGDINTDLFPRDEFESARVHE